MSNINDIKFQFTPDPPLPTNTKEKLSEKQLAINFLKSVCKQDCEVEPIINNSDPLWFVYTCTKCNAKISYQQ